MRQLKIFVSVIFSLFSLLLVGCFPNNHDALKQEVLLQGRTMGTTYNIKVVIAKNFDAEDLQQAIDDELLAVNQSMSTYIPDSELSLFNKSEGKTPIKISDGLNKVLTEALRLGEISEGKLDVTVGPLVNLWGFGPEYHVEKMPAAEQENAAKARIGLQHVQLNNGQLSKTIPDLYIDLSTIAKGYGVDVIAELLEGHGITSYLVEIGGEMRLKGFKADGTLWHVAVEKPVTEERSVHQIIVPKDNAVATSGDYRNYIEVDGQRYSHIIDPESARPINHKLVSVTVIHPSSMTADGLSTAIMVMGVEKGLAFAKEHHIAAMLIAKTADGFEEINTVKFMPYLK
ncbi:MAG: FAD:protein FMN transferase [Thalassotalea sp.]